MLTGASTDTIWFAEAPFPVVTDSVRAWRAELPGTTAAEPLSGPLAELLRHLGPRTVPSRRELVVATTGAWTALFSQGSDLATFEVVARRLRCRSLRTRHVPDEDTAFWLSDGARDDLAPLHLVRTIQATRQDGRWEWHLHGEPQPFEDASRYARRRVADRFTLEALHAYCDALGIQRDDPAAYGPEAVLFTRDQR